MPFNIERHAELRPKPRPWIEGKGPVSEFNVEEKMDGHRVTVYYDGRVVRVLGRKWWIDMADKLKPCSSLQVAIEAASSSPWTIIDGELVAPGQPATQVPHYIVSSPGDLVFIGFAIPWWRNQRVSYRESRELLKEELTVWSTELSYKVRPTKKDLQISASLDNIEGYIVKEDCYSSWWKIKPVQTIDVVVMSTLSGLGKHTGKHGALVCGVFDGAGKLVQITRVGKGCDDQWRGLPRQQLVGRVIEVTHEGVQAQGMLKFSSFARFRDDKPAAECTLSQLQ